MSKGKSSHYCSVFPQLAASHYLPYREEYNVASRTGILSPTSNVSTAPTPDTESVLLQYSALFTAKSPLPIGDIFQDPTGEA